MSHHRKGRMRVEIETPSGSHHVAEQSLDTDLIGLCRKDGAEAVARNRVKLIDQIMEVGNSLLLRIAAALGRGSRE